MADWRDRVGDKLVSAAKIAQMVSSGQTVHFTSGREPYAIGMAIAARRHELKNVKIVTYSPGYDFGWLNEGWQDSFEIIIAMPTRVSQEAVDARRCDLHPFAFNMTRPIIWFEDPDMMVTEVSPPDERGFCSFGQSLWDKKLQIADARERGIPIVAEVNEQLITTYGDNFVHASEIDYFVEHITTGSRPAGITLAGRAPRDTEPYVKTIAGYVAEMVKDGDTIQIGVGRTTEPLVKLGIFNARQDLGYHSEATPPGIITLIKEGVINGRRKSIHRHKAVITSLGGGTKDEMEWARNNPIFELLGADYVDDIRTVAANDNMLCINNALAIDLTGQVTAEVLGGKMISVPGGQGNFTIGSSMSRGGRAIHVLPSTALDGTVSRIMPDLPPGTVVTVPRYYMDYVVTEYGAVRLWGKTLRQRAEALISIAHPKFRDELRAAARERFWPR